MPTRAPVPVFPSAPAQYDLANEAQFRLAAERFMQEVAQYAADVSGLPLHASTHAGGSTDPINWSDLGQISFTGLASGDYVRYNGTNWVNVTLATLHGEIDHGSIQGLGDDDHSIYHTDARAATWHDARSVGTHSDVTLSGLAIGDYLRYNGSAFVNVTASVVAGTLDHGTLLGLGDDDHTHYLLAAGTRALTGHWNAGAFNITAASFIAGNTTLATGSLTHTGSDFVHTVDGTRKHIFKVSTVEVFRVEPTQVYCEYTFKVNTADIYLDAGYSIRYYNDSDHAYIPYPAAGQSLIRSAGNFVVQVDSDNNATTNYFEVRHNAATYSGGSSLFKVAEDGTISDSTGAFPVSNTILVRDRSVEVNDGSALTAKIAQVHVAATAPVAEDYPDGTIWCDTSAAAATSLDDLDDVVITSVGDGEVLQYDSVTSKWINQTLAEAGISAVGHAHAAADITSGTFDNARIAQSNVTQHQAALTILESQITDGSILARVAASETITGAWTFDNAARITIDDGSTLTAKVAQVHVAATSPAAEDYPDGTIWCDTSAAAATALDDLSDVTITAAANGDILMYNGSAWVDSLTLAGAYIFTALLEAQKQLHFDLSAGTGSGGRDFMKVTIDTAETYATLILGKEGGGDGAFRIWSNGGSGTLMTLTASATWFIGSMQWGGGSAISSSNAVALLADSETVTGAWTFDNAARIVIDDGSALTAKVAQVHVAATAPAAEDYPDGTIWCDTSAASATALGDLSDVTISSPATGHLLLYSAGAWINALTLSGAYTFTGNSLTVNGSSAGITFQNVNTANLKLYVGQHGASTDQMRIVPTLVSDGSYDWNRDLYFDATNRWWAIDGPLFMEDGGAGYIYFGSTSTYIHEGTGEAIRLHTNNGYVDIGPQNGAWCHVQTDRAGFYFLTSGSAYGVVSGDEKFSGYNADLQIRRIYNDANPQILLESTQTKFYLNVVPDTTNTGYVGTSSLEWARVYARSFYCATSDTEVFRVKTDKNLYHITGFIAENLDKGTISANFEIDPRNGVKQYLTLSNSATITQSWTTSSVAAGQLLILTIRRSSNSGGITWAADIDWGTAGAPTIPTTAGQAITVVLYAHTASEWMGAEFGQGGYTLADF